MATTDDVHTAPTTPLPEEPPPPAQHVVTISQLTRVLGLGLWSIGFLAAWLLLWRSGSTAFFVAAFVSLYGMCVWLAAADTLSRRITG